MTIISASIDDLSTADAALLEAARTDPAAFGALYKRYLARIYSYMRTRTHDDEEAADLAEQVFLQAWQALPKYQERGAPFAAWLFRIAHNVATDAGRRRRVPISWDPVPEAYHPHDPVDPEAMVLRQEAITRVCALVSGLDRAQRDLVMLRFVAELKLHEIAFVLGKSESAVHKQLVRTLQVLKERAHER